MTEPIVRRERDGDADAIHEVNVAAFGQPDEARIVDVIRGDGLSLLSLVAEHDGIVGHILFTAVTIETPGAASPATGAWAGLAPMAVAPHRQREGIGTALVAAGLEQCRALGIEAVVVLGHPEFYPRFGFRPASAFGLRCEFPVPDEVFMAVELMPGSLRGRGGLVRYLPVFSSGA
jgi:putative acetyltransferase